MPTAAAPSQTHVIPVPYDLGRRDYRMGLGPAHLVKNALPADRKISLERVEVPESSFEIGTTFQTLRSISQSVQCAIQRQWFPLVLAGSCISSVGTLAGMGRKPVTVIWFDAHGDFNTPETTITGFLDGMALAAITGRCWRALTETVEGFERVWEQDVILIGGRDLDPVERELLEASEIAHLEVGPLGERLVEQALEKTLDRLKPDRIYLHIDLDVLDVEEATVNEYSSPGGLTVEMLLKCVRKVIATEAVVAAAITAYDPLCDADGKALRAASKVISELCAIAAST